jgi:DNA-binding protein HU-beta
MITTKKQIIDLVSKKLDITNAESENYLNTLLETIGEELKTKDKVQFIGFGTFFAENKDPKKGRNPKTGADIIIPARRAVRLK